MHTTGRMLVVLSLVVGLGLGVPAALSSVDAPGAAAPLTLLVRDVAAQNVITDSGVQNGIANGGNGNIGRGGSSRSSADARGGNSGPGGDGGLAVLHDLGTAHADASSSVIVGAIATGDVHGHDVLVDARGATAPVVTLVAGSFGDTGVDIFAPGGNAQAGTTGGNSNSADASGGDSNAGDGGDATSRSGNGGNGRGGGNGGDPCVVVSEGCFAVAVTP